MNHMSKFELNQTVNESGKSIFLKLRISEKYTIVQRVKELAQRAKELAQRLCDASEYEKRRQTSQFHEYLNP